MFKASASPQKLDELLRVLSGNGKDIRLAVSLFGTPVLCKVTLDELHLLLNRARETGESLEARVFVEVHSDSFINEADGG